MSATTSSRSSADTSGITPNHFAKAGCGLVQQHAEAVDGLQPAPPGGREQRRLQRHVDDVGDDGVCGQQARVGRQSRCRHACRAKWCSPADRRRPGFPAGLRDRAPKCRLPKRCFSSKARSARAVGDADVADAGLLQREDDGARRAAGAERRRPARRFAIAARTGRDWRQSRRHRYCRRGCVPSSQPERVDRAGELGRLVANGDAGEGRLLVRDGDIAAGKARSAADRAGSAAKSAGAMSIAR